MTLVPKVTVNKRQSNNATKQESCKGTEQQSQNTPKQQGNKATKQSKQHSLSATKQHSKRHKGTKQRSNKETKRQSNRGKRREARNRRPQKCNLGAHVGAKILYELWGKNIWPRVAPACRANYFFPTITIVFFDRKWPEDPQK